MAKRSSSWILGLVSFIAIAFVGAALLLSICGLGGSISGALRTIAEILAYIVVACYAFFFAWGRGGKGKLICTIVWAVAVVLIIICLIIR